MNRSHALLFVLSLLASASASASVTCVGDPKQGDQANVILDYYLPANPQGGMDPNKVTATISSIQLDSYSSANPVVFSATQVAAKGTFAVGGDGAAGILELNKFSKPGLKEVHFLAFGHSWTMTVKYKIGTAAPKTFYGVCSIE